MLVMDSGKILVEGSPEGLVEKYAGYEVVEIRARQADAASLGQELQSRGIEYEDRGDSVLLYGENGSLFLGSSEMDGHQVTRRPGNLEDVFLRLTGRGLREE